MLAKLICFVAVLALVGADSGVTGPYFGWVAQPNQPANYTYDSFIFPLPNGKYLRALGRAGPYSGGMSTPICEYYDPITDSWSMAPSFPVGETSDMYNAVGAVTGSKVLIAGGNFYRKPKTVSYYLDADGASMWKVGPNLVMSAAEGTATTLSNGNILLTGGYHDWKVPHPALQVVYMSDNTTMNTHNMTTARAGHSAVVLQSGHVLLIGGFSSWTMGQQGQPENYTATRSCEFYDPNTGMTGSAGSLNFARYYHKAILLNNGNVLVSGGIDSNGVTLKSAEVYDPVSNSWSIIADMILERAAHSLTLLENGNVLALAGHPTNGSCEYFRVATGTWGLGDLLEPARTQPVVMYLPLYYRSLVVGGVAPDYTVLRQSAAHYYLILDLVRNYTGPIYAGQSVQVAATIYDRYTGVVASHYQGNINITCPSATVVSKIEYSKSVVTFVVIPDYTQMCYVYLFPTFNTSSYFEVWPRPTVTTTTTATTTTATTTTTTTTTTTATTAAATSTTANTATPTTTTSANVATTTTTAASTPAPATTSASATTTTSAKAATTTTTATVANTTTTSTPPPVQPTTTSKSTSTTAKAATASTSTTANVPAEGTTTNAIVTSSAGSNAVIATLSVFIAIAIAL